jgi:hypothetical protein
MESVVYSRAWGYVDNPVEKAKIAGFSLDIGFSQRAYSLFAVWETLYYPPAVVEN